MFLYSCIFNGNRVLNSLITCLLFCCRASNVALIVSYRFHDLQTRNRLLVGRPYHHLKSNRNGIKRRQKEISDTELEKVSKSPFLCEKNSWATTRSAKAYRAHRRHRYSWRQIILFKTLFCESQHCVKCDDWCTSSIDKQSGNECAINSGWRWNLQ